MERKVESLSTGKKVIFAIGQFGWSLAAYSGANLLTYFYMPPGSNEQALFPTYIFQGAILGIATIIGLISFGSRIFDAITDPWIANFSDRHNFKIGKRSALLAVSALPFALFSVLIFVPIIPHESVWNSVWLIFCILLYYLAVTAYCTPYNALISEYGHTPKGSLSISTFISVTWALGFALGSQVYMFRDMAQNTLHMSSTGSFQLVLAVFGIIALIAMLFPVLFIKESKYSLEHKNDENVTKSLISTLKNKNFMKFVASDLTYWLSLTFIQVGISYFVIVLLKLPESLTSFLLLILFVVSFIFYVPVNLAAKKFGKKRVIIFAFILLAIDFLVITFLNKFPISPMFQGYFIVFLAAIPMAIFGILPNAIVADLVEADGRTTGKYKAGIFFAARTFMMKLGISLANLIFPSFLLLGKDTTNDLGVRLAALAAFVFSIIGLIIFFTYDEKKVNKILEEEPVVKSE